jgi:hypothetical protein
MVVSFGMGRNPLISGASYRNILKIGPFCFGVAGNLEPNLWAHSLSLVMPA